MVQILVCGDVRGRLGRLFSRVNSVNKKNGPFECVLCVGEFFAPPGEEKAPGVDIAEYIAGAQKAPLPTYFVGGVDGDGLLAAMGDMAQLCDNIFYLGTSGIAQAHGLSIGFVSGIFKDAEDAVPGEAVLATLTGLVEADDKFAGVDILLTNQWGSGVDAGTCMAGGVLPTTPAAAASATIAKSASLVKPRYHFAGTENISWGRAPYRGLDAHHASRFIALGAVRMEKKGEKFLHALNLTTLKAMNPTELQQMAPGTTPDPYAPEGKRGVKREIDEPNAKAENVIFVRNLPYIARAARITEYFESAGPVAEVRVGMTHDGNSRGFCHVEFKDAASARRAVVNLDGGEFMDRRLQVKWGQPKEHSKKARGPVGLKPDNQLMGGSVDTCWFCLSNPQADVYLVANIGTFSYIVIDKGPIINGHVLIVPIDHFPSIAALPLDAYREIATSKEALRKYFASNDMALLMFERNTAGRQAGGNHGHTNCVPVPMDVAPKAKDAFMEAAGASGFTFEATLPPSVDATGEGAEEDQKALLGAVGHGEYLMVTLPDGSRLVHAIARGERHPMQFGRQVVAKLLGAPERADWKECRVDREAEEASVQGFQEAFAPFKPA